MMIDGDSPVARLCAAGMDVDGDASAAHALFMQAWQSRRDDFDASIAAHFVARHQPTAERTLYWNQLAVEHAMSLTDGRADALLASLYLNLGESLRLAGRLPEAVAAAARGLAALVSLPDDGYRAFVAGGLRRLSHRLSELGTP